jgi:alpha-1,3-rhamnosyl/mannosyltransferase
MRIGIDVSWAQGPPSGTATYIQGLVEALVRLGTQHEWILLERCQSPARGPALPEIAAANVRRVVVDAPLTNLRQQVTLPLALRRRHLDLYHSPAFFLPLAWRGPSVVSMFDLNFLRLRENWRPGRRRAYLSLALQVPLASRQARRIVTLSQTSAEDLVRLLRVPRRKIAVIPAAARRLFYQPPAPDELAAASNCRGRFLLSVGVLAPQKNLERLLQAFATIGEPDLGLVMVGPGAGRYAAEVLRPLIGRLGLVGRVTLAGRLDDIALRALYHTAVALVFPSLAEGFGLPIVEAMACGCPVIASAVSSMPEVAGDSGLLVDPYDIAALAGAMGKVLSSSELRADLAERGRKRAALFTWDQAALQTLHCYDEAVVAR